MIYARFLPLTLVGILCGAGPVPTTAPVVAPEARRVLDRVSRHVAKLDRFEVTVTTKGDIQTPGEPPQKPADEPPGVVTFERPARFGLTSDNRTVVISDGHTLTLFDPDPEPGPGPLRYWRTPAPATADHIVSTVAPVEMPYEALIVALLATDPGARLVAGAERVDYTGCAELDGVAHDRVRIVRAASETEVWVPADGAPFPRREVVDLSKVYGAAAKRLGKEPPRMLLTTDYTDWRAPDRPFGDERFAFDPPAGAVAVPTREALFRAEPAEAPWKATLNRPAPAFSLPGLDGKHVALADFKGKVVVLDFWATWCGPCVRGLPVIADVVRRHAGDGVVLLAVNVGQDAEKVRGFLNGQQPPVDARVLRDADAAVARAYKVGGIPHTVVVGRDGRVRAVHVGFDADATRQELDAALKDALAAPASQ